MTSLTDHLGWPALALFVVALLCLWPSRRLTAAPPPPQEKKVFADYFTGLNSRPISGTSGVWRYYHGEKVQWSGDLYETPGGLRKETATPYYPLIGPYDTLDPDVLEYHILLAKLAGIDGFLCEYATPIGHGHEVPAAMARLAKRLGFEVGIHWVPISFTNWSHGLNDRTAMLTAAQECLRKVFRDVYAVAGARSLGHPLVLIFGAQPEDYPLDQVKGTQFSGRELQVLRETLTDQTPWFLTWHHLNRDLSASVDGYFAWMVPSGSQVPPASPFDSVCDPGLMTKRLEDYYWSMRSQVTRGSIKTFMASVWPGFDDHKGRAWGEDQARFIPRDQGRTLATTWRLAKSSGANAILIATWNDWVESSMIEPSLEFGYQDLETCQREISTWKGIPLSVQDLRLTEQLLGLRRRIGRLLRSGVPASALESLQAELDQAALQLSEFKGSSAQALLHSVEKQLTRSWESKVRSSHLVLRWRPAGPATQLHLQWDGRADPQAGPCTLEGLQAFAFSTPLALLLPPELHRLNPATLIEGRLKFKYWDQGDQFIQVEQAGTTTSASRELANFRKRGQAEWRTVELDLLPFLVGTVPVQAPWLGLKPQRSLGLDYLAELELRLDLAYWQP